jgi:hypothetical protein
MARKRIFFISLFVVSVVGLAIIQYRYLRIGLNLARVQFSQKIAEAGAEIQQDLYGRNQLTFLLANALDRSGPVLDLMVRATLAFTLLSGFHYLWRTVRGLRRSGAGDDDSGAAA